MHPATGPSRLAVACREVLDFLLPARCLGCDERLSLEAAEPVCGACLTRLREPPWPRCPRCDFPSGTGRPPSDSCLACRDWEPALVAARSAVVLEEPAERLVYALKYEGWRELAPVMARRMAAVRLPAGAASTESLVVPVPTTSGRRRRRGYNQAALLAGSLAALTGREYAEALSREGGGGSQVSLRPSQRKANVRGAFSAVVEASSVAGRPVLLVDDVLTTGATAGEAALALERAGAAGVSVLTFARALPDRRRRPGRPD